MTISAAMLGRRGSSSSGGSSPFGVDIRQASRFSVARVPKALEIDDQLRAEMAFGLRLRVIGGVAAELVERLLSDPERAAVRDRAERARTEEPARRRLP